MEELRHGTWTPVNKQHGNETEGFWTERFLKCSACGYERRQSWLRGEKPNYCENCGSDMRGAEDEN
jgi:hypothetical protein